MFSSSRLYSTVLSMVHKGTAFEHRSRYILQENLCMSLRSVGGKADGGVDLIGWWWVPTSTHPSLERRRIRVLVQCKAEKKKPKPAYVRELEGVAHRFLATSGHHELAVVDSQKNKPYACTPVAAVLASEAPFSRGTLLRAYSSPVPLLLLHLPPERTYADAQTGEKDGEKYGEVGAAFWNAALAGTKGLLGGEVELRWERSVTNVGGTDGGLEQGIGRPGMWWRGRRVLNWRPGDEDMSSSGPGFDIV